MANLQVVTDVVGFRDLQYVGKETIKPGTVIYKLTGPMRAWPTRTSIQIRISGHAGVSTVVHVEDELGQFINHNCRPTVSVAGDKLVSLVEIHPGDSITFDYNQNEDVMAHPFFCYCCENSALDGGKLISGRRAQRP